MTRDDIEKFPELVFSGKLNWEQVAKELVVFIVKNKPMFGLQKYDEDFISDFIIIFLERGPQALSEFNDHRGSFLSYLFCMSRNIQSELFRRASIKHRIEYHNINESISEYYNKVEAYENINYSDFERPKVPFNCKRISFEDFQIACKSDSYQIIKIPDQKNKEFFDRQFKGYSPKIVKNAVIVLALKSSYYITDEQIEKICQAFSINKGNLFQIIQEIKMHMETRIKNKEKIEIRRNKAYFNHKTLRDRIEWNNLNNSEPYENLKLNRSYEKNTKSWSTLNHQLEEGKIHIRPTTKLIAKVLGISSRQVTYYQTTARKLGINIHKV